VFRTKEGRIGLKHKIIRKGYRLLAKTKGGHRIRQENTELNRIQTGN
jgi:hypothetical protein